MAVRETSPLLAFGSMAAQRKALDLTLFDGFGAFSGCVRGGGLEERDRCARGSEAAEPQFL